MVRTLIEKVKKAVAIVKEFSSDLGTFISVNWWFYVSRRTAFLLIVFPFLLLFLFWNPIGTLIVASLSLFSVFLLDSRKLTASKTDPDGFVKSEEFERWIERVFVAGVSIIYGLVFLWFGLFVWQPEQSPPGIITNYVLNAILVAMFLSVGVIATYFLNTLERSISVFFTRVAERTHRSHEFWSSFYVTDRARVEARMCVLLNALSKESNPRAIRKKTSLFKESLGIYNEHLGVKYDFIIREPDRFFKYVRLAALSSDKETLDKIREGLVSLIKQMEQKEDPFEFIRTIRTMTGESENKPSDTYKDIEVEPSRLVKQVRAHADLLRFIITITVTLIGSVILPLVLRNL
jgi:hypothetical protein